MSVLLNDKSTSTTKLLAGVSPVDAILNGTSRNAIQNKAVYNALRDKIEKSVNDLIYYYDTSQVYNKAEIRELIGQINTLTIEVVSTLPTQDISTTTIYFVGPAAGTNTYDEYIYNNNAWAKIGDTSIDLTQYVSSANLTTILQSYYTKTEIDNLFNSYYTKSEVDQLLENVEIDVDDTLSASSTNPIQNKVIKAKIDDIEDEIDTKQDKEFVGTTAQWNALTTEQKNQYVLVNLTDDKEALGVDAIDAVTNGDMRPVTSNAVYDKIEGTIVNVADPDSVTQMDYCDIKYIKIGKVVTVGGTLHFTDRPPADPWSSIKIASNLPLPSNTYGSVVNISVMNSSTDTFVTCCINSSNQEMLIFNTVIPLQTGYYRISGSYFTD